MESFNLKDLTLRDATEEDTVTMATWVKKFGWAYVDEGLLVAIWRAYEGVAADFNGELVGYISVATLRSDLQSLPVVIMREDFRLRGVGRVMMEKCLKSVGNKAVVIQSDNNAYKFYERCGVKNHLGNWHLYKTEISSILPLLQTSISQSAVDVTFLSGDSVIVSDFTAYEAKTVGFSLVERRKIVLELSKTGMKYAAVSNGDTVGILMCRESKLGDVPCFCFDILIGNTVDIAMGLLNFALKDISGNGSLLMLLFPKMHSNAKVLIERLHLREHYHGPTLSNHETINLDFENVYSVPPFN